MPAVVIDNPLGLTAQLSDGSHSTFYLKEDANPELARQLLLGLADMVHPHGDVDKASTIACYLTAVRDFVRWLEKREFTGSATDLTRAQLAELWMEAKAPPKEGRIRAMLLHVDDLHGLLRPETRELVEGRMYTSRRRRDRKPRPSYSSAEWERLTAVCQAAVDDAWRVHQQALQAVKRAGDPRTEGWTADNMQWLVAELGPVESTSILEWAPGHPSGYRKTEYPFEREKAFAALFPSPRVMLAYRLLFGVHTGVVPDGLADLGLGDIDWLGHSTVLLDYVKGRTAPESVVLSAKATRLLGQWLEHSALSRKFAPLHLRDQLWLRYTPKVTGHWTAKTADKQTVRRFAAAEGLVADDGQPFGVHAGRIRTTHSAMRDRRAWTGSRRATIDPNRSPQVEGDHYLTATTPEQLAMAEEIIAEAQRDLLRRAQPPIVLTDPKVEALVRDYPERVAALALDDAVLHELVGGERDVFTAACGDQLSGLHGPKGKPCPARPWVCLLCPLALFTPRQLPNLMRLRAYFSRQWDQMAAGDFTSVFGPYSQRLDEILRPDVHFTSLALTDAAAQVVGTDAELPLRPEETTR